MSESRRSRWEERALHAYHDGELRGAGRWRFERRLRRSPRLRAELEALALMRRAAREGDETGAEPDLWDAIELRLPAIDAEAREDPPRHATSSFWSRPLMGAVAAGAAALALAIGLSTGNTGSGPAGSGSVVQWIESGDRGVMVLEDDEDVTIIWVFDDPTEGAARGGAPRAV